MIVITHGPNSISNNPLSTLSAAGVHMYTTKRKHTPKAIQKFTHKYNAHLCTQQMWWKKGRGSHDITLVLSVHAKFTDSHEIVLPSLPPFFFLVYLFAFPHCLPSASFCLLHFLIHILSSPPLPHFPSIVLK